MAPDHPPMCKDGISEEVGQKGLKVIVKTKEKSPTAYKDFPSHLLPTVLCVGSRDLKREDR
jgi:hypothetical protein